MATNHIVVFDRVLVDIDMIRGHNDEASACRNFGYQVALRRKILRVVGVHFVLKDARVAAVLHRQIGKIENQQPTGVVGGRVLINVGFLRVFNLDSSDVVFGAVAAHDDVLRLAHIDSGIRSSDGGRVFDQNIFALHWIKTVGPVTGLGSAGPFGAHAADGHACSAVDFKRVTLAVFDGQVFESESSRSNEHSG